MSTTTTVARFVVMTARAKATETASKYGYNYRNVAVVETDQRGLPKMMSDRAKHFVRFVKRWDSCSVGKTERSAYRIALAEAEALVAQRNAQSVRWLVENQLTDNKIAVVEADSAREAIDAAYRTHGWQDFADARAKRATAAQEHEIVARRLDAAGDEVGPFFNYAGEQLP